MRDATPTDFGARLLIGVERVRDGGRERPVSGGARVTVGGSYVDGRVAQWVAGRRVRMPVAFRRAPRFLNPGVADQERALMRRGVALLGSVKSALLVEVVEAGPPWQEASAAARAFVRRAIDAAVGRHDRRSAGIVTAILIGDRAGLDTETRQRLQAAGTFHVIAISGGNIAILTSVLLGVLRLAGVPPRAAAVGALACLLAYWQIVGAEASVARATFVASMFLAARAADQRTSSLNTLALSAMCLVAAAPLALTETGFLLTFGATLGILVGVPRTLGLLRLPRAGWARRALLAPAGLLAASVCAELALLPVAASAFSRVTAAGLLLNFAAIPLMTVTQIAGLLAVAASGVSAAAASLCGQIAHLATTGIVASAHLVDLLPQLARRVPPPGPLLTIGYYGGWALALAAGRWPALRAAGAGLAAATGVALAAGVVAGAGARACPGESPVRALFLDVDQADSTLVQFPTGESLLVDAAGVPWGVSAVGERVIAPALWRAGVRRLDYLALTHGDPDHVGGAEAVLRDFRPREVWEGVPVPASGRLRRLQALALDGGAVWRTLQAGETLQIGDAQLIVWHPAGPGLGAAARAQRRLARARDPAWRRLVRAARRHRRRGRVGAGRGAAAGRAARAEGAPPRKPHLELGGIPRRARPDAGHRQRRPGEPLRPPRAGGRPALRGGGRCHPPDGAGRGHRGLLRRREHPRPGRGRPGGLTRGGPRGSFPDGAGGLIRCSQADSTNAEIQEMAETALTPMTTDERLTRIETELEHVATKADLEKLRTDLEKLRVWFLTAGLGAGSAGGLITWLARILGDQ